MARRLRLPSWVEDEEPLKSVPPLRHRLSRAEKALDLLDSQERELHALQSTLDPEEYDNLANLIHAKRSKLALQREKEATPYIAPSPKEERPTTRPRASQKPLHVVQWWEFPKISNKAWGVITFVILLALIR